MSLSLSAVVVAKRILAAISAGRVKASISAGRVLASISASRISASISAASLKAAIAIGRFLLRINAEDSIIIAQLLSILYGKTQQDSVAMTDEQAFDVDKGLSETPLVSEQHAITYSRPETDSYTASDQSSILVGKNFLEFPNLAEDTIFAFDKSISDSINVTDDIDGNASIEDDQNMEFVKVRAETAQVAELHAVAFNRPLTDTGALSDVYIVEISKILSESLSVAESFSRVVTFVRSFSETVYVTDDINEAGVDDDQNVVFFKRLTNIGSTSDTDVKSVGKNPSDSANFTESGAYEVQDYVDNNGYFAENYVGTTGSLF